MTTAQKIVESIMAGKSADAVEGIHVALAEKAKVVIKESLLAAGESYNLKRLEESKDESDDEDEDEDDSDESDEDDNEDDDLNESVKFKKGDSVTIKNAKSYDALAKSDTVTGTIMGNVIKHRGDEYYDIKVGSGQYTARVKDISLED